MKQIFYVVLWMLLALSGFVLAAEPDFSGDWVLEEVNGIAHGTPFTIKSPEADSEIVIAHARDSFVISSDCVKCGNLVKEYILDGRTREMPNDKKALISYSAKRDAGMIVIKQGFGGPTPFGSVVVLTEKLFSISPDKETLTVFSTNKDPEGVVTMTQIYKKIR